MAEQFISLIHQLILCTKFLALCYTFKVDKLHVEIFNCWDFCKLYGLKKNLTFLLMVSNVEHMVVINWEPGAFYKQNTSSFLD